MRASLAFSTYQAGKLFLLGLQTDGRLSVFERTFERAMGLAVRGPSLYLSTVDQLWRFHDALSQGQTYNGYDRLFIPKESRVTGDIDIHDVAVEDSGRVVFVSTLFNCVATTDDQHSFRKLWAPPWISQMAAEDRCHLNGLGLRDGEFRYCTSVSRSDVSDGWRDKRVGSGVLIDISNNRIVCEGLSMPHSPRWHNGHIYLLESGTGFLGRVDPLDGEFHRICFLPGFARGMAIVDRWAVIGLSDRRENRSFQDLPIDAELAQRDAEPRCGLQIVDLQTGESPHWVRIEGIVRELYDVAVVAGSVRPMAIGFKTDEVRRMVSFRD